MANETTKTEKRNLKCPYCGGTGNYFHPKSNGKCPVCHGFKRVTANEKETYVRSRS